MRLDWLIPESKTDLRTCLSILWWPWRIQVEHPSSRSISAIRIRGAGTVGVSGCGDDVGTQDFGGHRCSALWAAVVAANVSNWILPLPFLGLALAGAFELCGIFGELKLWRPPRWVTRWTGCRKRSGTSRKAAAGRREPGGTCGRPSRSGGEAGRRVGVIVGLFVGEGIRSVLDGCNQRAGGVHDELGGGE